MPNISSGNARLGEREAKNFKFIKISTFLFESHFLFHNNYHRKTMTKKKSIKSIFFHLKREKEKKCLNFISSYFTNNRAIIRFEKLRL